LQGLKESAAYDMLRIARDEARLTNIPVAIISDSSQSCHRVVHSRFLSKCLRKDIHHSLGRIWLWNEMLDA
jgi:hypothetical protein